MAPETVTPPPANQNQNPPTQQNAVNQTSIPASIYDIVNNLSPEDITPPPNTQGLPLPYPNQNGNDPLVPPGVETPPQDPLIPSPHANQPPLLNQDDFTQQINSLLDDISNTDLEGKETLTSKSRASFEGLKARYRNSITELRDKYNELQTKLAGYEETNQELSALKERIGKVEFLEGQIKELSDKVSEQESELSTARYFRRRYDFENDPFVQREYIAPMRQYEQRAKEIIKHAGLDESFWQDLVSAESEFAVNDKIDQTSIRGLNATTLKEMLSRYQYYSRSLADAARPEVIDAEIARLHGRGKADIKNEGNKIFEDILTSFSAHVEELQSSEVNKEHNFFVRDRVVENARLNFEAFCEAINPESLNPRSLTVLSKAALTTAAYPYQATIVNHLLEERHKLLKEIETLRGTPGVSQIREQRSDLGSSLNVGQVKAMSPEEIAESVIHARKN